MGLSKKLTLYVGSGLGVLLLFGMFQSQATNITFLQEEYGKSQEQIGADIKEAAWLEFNRGRVQENLGRFIQEGGPEGNVLQEELGSGIAAAAHIRWATMRSQEALGGSIVRVAQVLAQDAQIVVGRVQEGFGTRIAGEAQEVFGEAQEALGRQILQTAQLDYAGGIMATALQASLRGEATVPISSELISTVRRNGGYNQLSNFVLAVSLLEGETGLSLSPLTVNMSSGSSSGSTPVTDTGWGGFAEYGFFAIAGFLFAMWMAGSVVLHDGAPMEEMEEEEYPEYRKAA